MENLFAITPLTKEFLTHLNQDEFFKRIEQAIKHINGDDALVVTPYVDHNDPLEGLLRSQDQPVKTLKVSGPLAQKSTIGRYGYLDNQTRLVVDVGSVLGEQTLTNITKTPLMASSRGVGELLKQAVTSKTKKITFVNLENIASDLGMGVLQELGATFYSKTYSTVAISGGKLSSIYSISFEDMDKKWLDYEYEFITLIPKNEILTGENGIAFKNAKLTGATPELAKALNYEFESFSKTMEQMSDHQLAELPHVTCGNGFPIAFSLFFSQVKIENQSHLYQKIIQHLLDQKIDYYMVYAPYVHFRQELAKKNQKVLIFGDLANYPHLLPNELMLPIDFDFLIQEKKYELMVSLLEMSLKLMKTES